MEENSYFGKLGIFLELIETVVVCAAIFFIIYLFVAQFHKVSGESMKPTFQDGDYIITEKISYRFGLPERGDKIVLKDPRNESRDFIKRILATPGDTVKIENNTVLINGTPFDENYLPKGTLTKGGSFLHEGSEVKVGENQYYVFGDNREHSSDSREWGGITKEEIVGKTFFRYWPAQSIGFIYNKNSTASD